MLEFKLKSFWQNTFSWKQLERTATLVSSMSMMRLCLHPNSWTNNSMSSCNKCISTCMLSFQMDNLYRLKIANVTLQVTDVNHTQNEYQPVHMAGLTLTTCCVVKLEKITNEVYVKRNWYLNIMKDRMRGHVRGKSLTKTKVHAKYIVYSTFWTC